jgi:hypothetical protein
MEQELLTLPEHLSSPPVVSGVRVTRSLVLYVCLVDIVVCPFVLFLLAIVLSVLLLLAIVLSVLLLLTIVLSVLLRYTDSDWPFGIYKLILMSPDISLFVLLFVFFWPLCCLSVFDLRILITPLVSLNSSY